ncbi:MAG: toll/interleukin-1 receptor domain-containing protein [Methylobacter sp.]
MMEVKRGAKRTAKPDIFISHSSKDKNAAFHLAKILNYCAIDVWLDDWELEVGQSLTDEISKAMEDARYIAILITENYNKSVWTKTEYKKALSREQKEQRTVMLPLIVGEAVIPDFLEDKVYIDLRDHFFRGIVNLVGMVHEISRFRISEALRDYEPSTVLQTWELLESIGFEPYVVVGEDDFKEMLAHGGRLIRDDYATFYPHQILNSDDVSKHVKALVGEIF